MVSRLHEIFLFCKLFCWLICTILQKTIRQQQIVTSHESNPTLVKRIDLSLFLKMLRIIRITVNATARLSLDCPVFIQEARRNAGHSKWANIKHQKGANDTERNRIFTRLSRMIKVAITEGKSSDPEMNGKLQSVIGLCRRANMPQSTITNSIKAASTKGPDETTYYLHIRGPGRCCLLVQILTTNPGAAKNQVAAIMKKHACKYDTSVLHEFMEKGVLTASPLKDSQNVLDDATEHAINASVEEVTLDEETGKLRFECSPEATMKAKKALEGLGYTVDSAIVEYYPNSKAPLDDAHLELLQKFITKVEALPEVINVIDNIE